MADWTTPKTWQTGETLVASDMNTHIRDNLGALKAPPTDTYELNQGSDYTTTSTSFVDVDATNLALTITTTGGDVLIGFYGSLRAAALLAVYFDVHESVANARIGGDDGIIVTGLGAYAGLYNQLSVQFVRLVTGLAAGSHTFKLQWKVNTSTVTLLAGAGTSGGDVHPQFWVREV